jgi:hypothetical protein
MGALIVPRVTTRQRTLDFVVVGAAKAGTTALFEYLRTHPEIALPREKETGFFVRSELYERGWDWYARSFLDDLPDGKKYGEVSPAYMWGTPHSGKPLHAPRALPPSPQPPGVLERIVPERIAEAVPRVKVICVLRDPVERAISHYQMSVLWGWERRNLDSAMTELLVPDQLEVSRRWITGTNWYVTLGEYGRILTPYFDVFPSEQVLVIFSRDLLTRREDVVRNLLAFIGVDHTWLPPNLDTRFRQAATSRRIRQLDLYQWRHSLADVDLLRHAWRRLPKRRRALIDRFYSWATFRLDMWNARRGDARVDAAPGVRSALECHFRADALSLASVIGRQPPWLQDW